MNRRLFLSMTTTLAALTIILSSVSTRADAWQRVADLRTGGGAKEVTVNKKAAAFRVVAVEGTVIINTFVVREGGKKTPYKVARKLVPKQEHVIKLPARTLVTGLRISDDSKGRYIVHWK